MPIPGYFSFPAFAVECFAMYVWVRALDLAVRGEARVDIIRGSAPGPGVRSASVATAEQRSWQDVHDIGRA
jgi:hypothetical protein